mgnify:CR=1 FL=1
MSDRNSPAEGIYTRRLRHRTEHVVVIVLTADEAENIADALGHDDAGGEDLRRWADEARQLDNPEETNR